MHYADNLYLYNCTFLHKNNHDRNRMRAARATTMLKLHRNVRIKIDVSASNFNNSDVIYLHTSPAINYI